MDFRQLQRQIKSGKVSNLYLVYGDDTWQVSQAIQALQETIPLEERLYNVLKLDGEDLTPAQLEANLQLGLLGEGKVILIEGSPLFKSGSRSKENSDQQSQGKSNLDQEETWLQLFEQKDHILVFYDYANLDRRRRLVRKVLEIGTYVQCSQLKGQDMTRAVQDIMAAQGLKGEFRLIAHLALIADNQLGIAQNEISKLALNFPKNKVITLSEALPFLSEGVEANVFEIIDLIAKKDNEQAQKILSKILDQNQEPMRILGALRFQLRRLSRVKVLRESGLTEAAMAKKLSLHSYLVKQSLIQSRVFSKSSLNNLLFALSETEDAILSGKRDRRLALEFFLSQVIASVQ